MYVIGIDPHRGSHAAAVLDGDERVRAVLQLPADRQQRQRLLDWASEFTPRLWAVEGATGTGALARPAARRRRRAGGRRATEAGGPGAAAGQRPQRQDRHPRRPLHRHRRAAQPAGCDRSVSRTTRAVLRLLAKRHHDLIAARTRAICRLHTTVCFLIEGHLPRRSAGRTGRQDPRRHPPDHGDRRRTQGAGPRPARRGPPPRPRTRRPQRAASATPSTPRAPRSPSCTASARSSPPTSSATAATSAGSPVAGHYARYNATAPIEASSGPVDPAPAQPTRQPPAQPRHPHDRRHPGPQRHTRPRLLPAQAGRRPQPQRSDARPQAAHQRRRLPPTRHRQPPLTSGPGRAHGNVSNGQRDRLYTLTAGSSVKPLPDPPRRYAPRTTPSSAAPRHPGLVTFTPVWRTGGYAAIPSPRR